MPAITANAPATPSFFNKNDTRGLPSCPPALKQRYVVVKSAQMAHKSIISAMMKGSCNPDMNIKQAKPSISPNEMRNLNLLRSLFSLFTQ
jgi:hypothetical protein